MRVGKYVILRTKLEILRRIRREIAPRGVTSDGPLPITMIRRCPSGEPEADGWPLRSSTFPAVNISWMNLFIIFVFDAEGCAGRPSPIFAPKLQIFPSFFINFAI